MLIYTVELGFPPSLNNLYGTGRDGRRHLSVAGREWHKDADDRALAQWPKGGVELPLRGGLSLSLMLHPPHKMHYDADGKIKIVQDWLAAYFGFDDARIDRVCVEKSTPYAFGRVMVRLETMD